MMVVGSVQYGREGADLWTFRNFYKVVFKANLLFGSETWMVTPRIGSTLGGFHNRLTHRMEGM